LQPIGVQVSADPPALRLLSLDSRIGLLRRRRRINVLRQLIAVIGPVLLGGSILLLIAAGGVFASAR